MILRPMRNSTESELIRNDLLSVRREDPFFGLKTPLLFAHRGGVLEQPQSTKRAFHHAVCKAKADVLELDVNLTRDGTFVVWHGPKLDNVLIDGIPTKLDQRTRNQNNINCLHWAQLEGRAWVTKSIPLDRDLRNVQQSRDTELMRLDEFLGLFSKQPLNIELKKAEGVNYEFKKLTGILSEAKKYRPILVTSLNNKILRDFRSAANNEFSTGLSFIEIAALRLRLVSPFFNCKDICGRAVQTSYADYLTPRSFITKVRQCNAAIHVFLTKFWHLAPAIDFAAKTPSPEKLWSILDRGVDGIMTDRPSYIRPILDQWIGRNK